MQLLAWISNLSASNKHISQLPLAFFFIFENVLTRLFCSLNRKEKGSEKLYRIFLHTMRFESWFDYERIFSSSWFPQRTSLTSPTKFLPLNYVWAWRHKWATTWDDFSSNCAQRIQFLLMRWNLFIFCVCARCNVALFYINICFKHLQGISFFNWLSNNQQQWLKVF